MNNPYDLLDKVKDEKSFIEFAQLLLLDHNNNQANWGNCTLEQFLDAAIAWAEATDMGASQGMDSASPWKRFATFLYCGKIYE